MTRMQMPPELISHIVYYLVHDSLIETDQLGVSIKPPWSSVHGFSLASRTFRTILLENWFQRLYITGWDHVTSKEILMFPDIFVWAKELHCVQKPYPAIIQFWTTNGLIKVRKLRLDWLCSRRAPYRNSPLQLFFATTGAARITDFDLRGTDQPTPIVMIAIAHSFPALQRLRLVQREIWCGLCNTCSVPEFKNPTLPLTIVYKDGLGLPARYSGALSALQRLEVVDITVSAQPCGTTTLSAEKGGNDNLWSGECDSCMVRNYKDEKFRADWVERKCKPSERRPPCLREVIWRFKMDTEFRASFASSDDDEDEEAEGSDGATVSSLPGTNVDYSSNKADQFSDPPTQPNP